MEDEHEVEFLLEEPDSGLADGGSDGSSDLSKSQPIITAHRSTTRVPVGLAWLIDPMFEIKRIVLR